jgi:radical SAM protein with 4Fe4S-binding SPASM domain
MRKVISRKKEFISESKAFFSKFTHVTGRNIFSCGAGIKSGCIDAYGYFQLCTLLRHPDTVYDLKRGSLKYALDNFVPKVRRLKTNNNDYLGRCAQCFLKSFCSQCPARSYMEHGVLDSPVEYHCDVTHELAHFLGLLKNKEKVWNVSNWRRRVNDFCAS